MVGVRPPAAWLKQVDNIAAALSCDRSGGIRWLLDRAMSGLPRALLPSGKGRGITDAIVLATVADIKAKAAADAVETARPAASGRNQTIARRRTSRRTSGQHRG